MRETTGLLPRKEAIDRGLRRKSPSDWAYVALFGAISWPWLLFSLSGGPEAQRAQLLSRLELPAGALPNLGSWKADIGFLNLIAEWIFALRPNNVVEFGIGASTLVAAQALKLAGAGRLMCFDEHADFVASTRDWLAAFQLRADFAHAPLTRKIAGWPGRWYAHGPMPPSIDILIIDGPHWAVHPFVRGGADSLFNRIAEGGVILMDDGARPGERIIAGKWRKKWPDFDFQYVQGGSKGAWIGRRLRAC